MIRHFFCLFWHFSEHTEIFHFGISLQDRGRDNFQNSFLKLIKFVTYSKTYKELSEHACTNHKALKSSLSMQWRLLVSLLNHIYLLWTPSILTLNLIMAIHTYIYAFLHVYVVLSYIWCCFSHVNIYIKTNIYMMILYFMYYLSIFNSHSIFFVRFVCRYLSTWYMSSSPIFTV